MNISLPDSLKHFVDQQVTDRGYGTSSEYVRELIRHDHDRQLLRRLLLDGASSAPGAAVDGPISQWPPSLEALLCAISRTLLIIMRVKLVRTWRWATSTTSKTPTN